MSSPITRRPLGYVHTLDFKFRKLATNDDIDAIAEELDIDVSWWRVVRIPDGNFNQDGDRMMQRLQKLGYDGIAGYDSSHTGGDVMVWVVFNAARQVRRVSVIPVQDLPDANLVALTTSVRETLEEMSGEASDVSTDFVQRTLSYLQRLPNNLTVYRLYRLKKPTDLRTDNLGGSWTEDLKSLEHSAGSFFLHHNDGDLYYVVGSVHTPFPHIDVTWTIANRFVDGDVAPEKEVRFHPRTEIELQGIYRFPWRGPMPRTPEALIDQAGIPLFRNVRGRT